MNPETHPLLQALNAQQREAVTASEGPLLILAGPGSGKTRVLTHRIAWLLSERQLPAWQIMAVTFTNKAAREMRERLTRMLGRDAALEMTLGTFHATCARILRRESERAGLARDYVIFDTDDQLAVMKAVVSELGLDDKRYRPSSLLNAVSRAKNELVLPADYPRRTYYDELVARAYARYQERLRQSSGLDFDDLLLETVRLFRADAETLEKYRRRFRAVLVDEFQDTNIAQYTLLRLLTQEHRHLYAVADEDQSIYSWRGADYRNIQRLREDFPELRQILLEENYRSTQIILDGAMAVISRNLDRTPKRLFTRKAGGLPVTLHESYDEREEAQFVAREVRALRRGGVAYGGVAVMYRTNAQSRALEESFVNEGIPYRLVGGTRFYSRKEIKDLLAYLRLAQNPDDDVSFQRVVNVPPRGIGQRTLETIGAQAREGQTSLYRAMVMLLAQGTLDGRTRRALEPLATLIQSWHAARETLSVGQLMDRLLSESGYGAYVQSQVDEVERKRGESRWENILALRAVAEESAGVTLSDFLTEVALVADVDQLDESVDAVTLLTLHSAKGLEYPVVFVTGLEEGLLPHSQSLDSPQELAEERRLLYVGMTRAQERLYLTYAFRRGWYGNNQPAAPSRFLDDLPDEVLGRARRGKAVRPTGNWGVSAWSREATPAPPPRPAVAPRFRAGQRVRHARYGEGVVAESAVEGDDEVVTVRFKDSGIGFKKFVAGMAPLEPLSEH